MKKRKFSLFVVTIAIIALLLFLPGQILAKENGEPKERFIVMFDDEIIVNVAAQEALLTVFGADLLQPLPIINGYVVMLPPSAMAPLIGTEGVIGVEKDAIIKATLESLPWGVDRIDAELVWAGGNTGAGVDIAIIDTGIDYTHSDLDDNYLIGGLDYVNGDVDPMDDNGHGTHVAGTVAAENNGIGVIGVSPQANLYALKVLDKTGSGYYSYLIDALGWCVVNGIEVANMSLGGSFRSRALQKACDNAYKSGVLLVAAAGNLGISRIDYPARYDSVIAVSATDINNNLAIFSNYGGQIELAAPGVDINSTLIGGGYGEKDGTSMAAPHVSGTAALVIASEVVSGAPAVREQLTNTAEDLGPAGEDNYFGYGLVDAAAAVQAPSPPPEEEGTMYVSSIDMWYEAKGPNFFIYTTVTIVDDSIPAVPVAGATVDLETTTPTGSVTDSSQTGEDGSVTFKFRSRDTGIYTSTVIGVTKSGWTYESPDLKPSCTLTIP